MARIFIGIDNGVSGSISVVAPNIANIIPTPIFNQLNYTKEKAFINRVNTEKLEEVLYAFGQIDGEFRPQEVIVGLERPMVNPGRFKATISAIRCLEATLIVLEHLKLPYRYIDSKEWQKIMLPKQLEGDELKRASLDVGKRLYPHLADKFKKDADSILIAAYLQQRENAKEL